MFIYIIFGKMNLTVILSHKLTVKTSYLPEILSTVHNRSTSIHVEYILYESKNLENVE